MPPKAGGAAQQLGKAKAKAKPKPAAAKRKPRGSADAAVGAATKRARGGDASARPKAKGRAGAAAAAAAAVEEGPAVPQGPQLRGVVSAWYPEVGLTGRRYGFIELRESEGGGGAGGLPTVVFHHFDASDVDGALLGTLEKGMPVRFRAAGMDLRGRRRAAEVRADPRAAGRAPAKEAAEEPEAPRREKAAAPSAATPEAAGGGGKAGPPAWLRELVLDAWRKLGGEATLDEVARKIQVNRKLAARLREHLGGADEGESCWERRVPKVLKGEGEWTGERRFLQVDGVEQQPDPGVAAPKVFRLREELLNPQG